MASNTTNMNQHETSTIHLTNPNFSTLIADSVEKAVQNSLDARLNRLENLITTKVNSNSKQIGELKKQSVFFDTRLKTLEKQAEALESEVREKNIIITGLNDNDREDTRDLFQKVSTIFRDITQMNIRPDKVYRIGKYNQGFHRNVRVKLLTVSEKDIIMDQRRRIKPPMYFNDDEPYTIRFAKKLLRDKRRECYENGIESSIDFKNWCVNTKDGDVFKVIDGKLVKYPSRRKEAQLQQKPVELQQKQTELQKSLPEQLPRPSDLQHIPSEMEHIPTELQQNPGEQPQKPTEGQQQTTEIHQNANEQQKQSEIQKPVETPITFSARKHARDTNESFEEIETPKKPRPAKEKATDTTSGFLDHRASFITPRVLQLHQTEENMT